MKRREFLKDCIVGAGFLGLGAAAARAAFVLENRSLSLRLGHKRPNIIFIMADDMGWRDAGFMGSLYYETPNIDKLAGQGMVFTNAYANAANCAPTRASFLTGKYTPRHGI